MMIYQVSVWIDHEREADWLAWMRDHHIQDVLNTGHFTGAELLQGEEQPRENACYTIRYHAPDQAALDAYQAGPAAALKADHLARFPKVPAVQRDIFHILRTY